MAFTLSNGCFVVKVRYLQRKPDGSLWYYRRIPRDLKKHYGSKTFFRESLGTRDPLKAAKAIARKAQEHDALWKTLRSPQGKQLGLLPAETREAAKALLDSLDFSPGEWALKGNDFDPGETLDGHFQRRYGREWLEARHGQTPEGKEVRPPVDPDSLLNSVELEALRLLQEPPGKPRVLLSDALRLYLEEHKKGSKTKFIQGTRVAFKSVYDCVGDLPLGSYTRENARSVRDSLAKGRSSATVRRRLATIIAVFTKGVREFGLNGLENPFAKLEIKGLGEDTKERLPFSTVDLKVISEACHRLNDDVRWIVALQADTGARLGEIVGLRVEDIFLEGEGAPFVWIREHKRLGRTLKTPCSERKVPLVGESLWATNEALSASTAGFEGGWLFPRYASDGEVRATHASNTINKWIKGLGIPKTTHSFRHAMRDRLRAASVPNDIQDAIGGWTEGKTIGQGYGQGYPLEMLREALEKVVLR